MTSKTDYEAVVYVAPQRVIVMESRKPKFSQLQAMVQVEIKDSDWWDVRGEDLILMLATICMVLPSGLVFIGSANPFAVVCGFVAMGYFHHTALVKAGHLFAHGVLGLPDWLNTFLKWFAVELIGGFPAKLASESHIQLHHPYTNVIGLGDSSTWKVPVLPRSIYMFIAPLILPMATPFIGLFHLYPRWNYILKLYIPTLIVGYGTHIALLMHVSKFSFWGAVLCCWATRALFMTPYIYVNIFQHIGLNMYDLKKRPDRLILMSTAVLNLPRNIFLDYAFGHSIVSCHIEHHLFPSLSDKMCLKIKPIVQKFFKENGLIYNERGWMDRFQLFWDNYDELLVYAPPITELVAVQ